MERYAASHPGTALFVRPTYEDPTWIPATIDYGVVIDGRLLCKRFQNGD
jgi:hypothetical protein